MNSIERVKAICKERKIAISKLEKDLGFGNGYISQLKKGFPEDRLYKIADYLEVTPEYIVFGNEKTATISGDGHTEKDELKRLIDRLTDQEVHELLGLVRQKILGL